jgi:hypothetical protein
MMNDWYSELNLHYSKFIFICARARAFFRFFFFHKQFDKSKFIFSHFEFIKWLKIFYVKIYFYYIPVLRLIPKIFFNT